MTEQPEPTSRPGLAGRIWERRRVLLLLVVWSASLMAAFVGGAFAYRHRAQLRSLVQSVQASPITPTNLYNLRVQKVMVDARGRDGGIAALKDGILFANRFGHFWYVDARKTVHPLPLRVPINVEDFEADPYNANTLIRENFGVKDILIQPLRSGFRLLASYNYWHRDSSCYTMRVSSIETTFADVPSGGANGGGADPGKWVTHYETRPCRPLTDHPDGKHRNPTLAAGGRMVPLSEDRILLTVGGFGPEFQRTMPRSSEGPDYSYGRLIEFDLRTGRARPYSIGHRNPQGLALGLSGEIWETEHGPRGGDELNLIRDGANYGEPFVTYGTEYGQLTWPGNPQQGRHEGYEKPIFAWVPSIGISNLIVLRGAAFPYWAGDIFVTSLNNRTVFRVRVEHQRVIFVEPIVLDHRLRDIVEAADGSIVLKTDDNLLVFLSPAGAPTPGDSTLPPTERGALVAAQCQGCHALSAGGADAIGPSLWGVVGRKIAGRPGYQYSDALRAHQGEWTPERLRNYLADPAGFAPGTSMQLPSKLTDRQITDLLAYLRTLK